MLSYYIIDLGYSANLFCIMTILLKYKRSRRTLPLAYVLCLLLYMVLDYIVVIGVPGVSWRLNFVLGAYFEMFATFIILCIFTSGNIWRNYVHMILCYILLNALSGFFTSLNAKLDKLYAGYIVNGTVPVEEAFVLALIVAISGLIMAFIMSRLIKKEYNGNGTIYKVFSFLYMLIGLVQMFYKQDAIIDSLEENDGVGITKVVYVVMGITTFYIFGLLYYRYEGKRLAKENKILTEYIRDNHERYQKLVEDNSKMSAVKTEFLNYSKEVDESDNQSYKDEIQYLAQEIDHITLTGNIVIDALIKNSYEQAKRLGISYEIIPGNVVFAEDKIINFASIVENILLVANDYAQEAKEKWMYLSFRQNGDMILVKAEFSKNKKSKLSTGNNVFAKLTANMQRLKIIKSLSETMCGTTSIVNGDEEGCISILLNNA